MRPLLLKFSALGPYAAEQVLDFAELKGRNFFLIHGATGAGKTTILDAVCFALYGDSSGNLRDGRMMRSNLAAAVRATEVDLTFALGTEIYRVWRRPEQSRPKKRGDGFTLSAADAALYRVKEDGESLAESGYAAVTARVEALLGFKSSQFRQVVLLPQGEFRQLLLANSAQRQEIMQALFKTELYEKIEETLKRQARDIEAERSQTARLRDFLLQELAVESLAQLTADCAALRESIAAGETVLAGLRERQLIDGAAVTTGRVLEAKFAQAAAAAAKLAECEKELPEATAKRSLYERARQAAWLRDITGQVDSLAAAARADERLAGQRQAEIPDLRDNLKLAKQRLEAEVAQDTARQANRRELAELEQAAVKAAAWQEAVRTAATAGELAAEMQRRLESAREAAGKIDGECREQRESIQTIIALAAQADGRAVQLETFKQLARKAAAATELSLAIKTAAAERTQAEAADTAARERYAEQEIYLERLRELFAAGQAAVLAERLKDGEPCPVCGSRRHPCLAIRRELIPTERELKAAQRELTARAEARRQSEAAARNLRGKLELLTARYNDLHDELSAATDADADVLAERVEEAEHAHAAAVAAARRLVDERKRLMELERRRETTERELAVAAERQSSAAAEYAAAQAALKQQAAQLPERYRDPAVIEAAQTAALAREAALAAALQAAQEEERSLSERLARTETELATLHRQLAARREEFERQSTELADRLKAAGFNDMADYRAALRPDDSLEEWRVSLAEFDERFIAAQAAVSQARAAVAGLTPPDMSALTATATASAARYDEASAVQLRSKDKLARLTAKERTLRELTERLAQFDEQYRSVGYLAEIAGGKNERGLSFQRYVLQALLDDVIDAANMRLKVMSRGQYLLESSDRRARRNAAGGLEIAVFDNYTGYARPVTTLSGGETFLASLSLALGLADVVQSYAGGIHLDMILVDEGFGTLDAESLDIALRALLELRQGGRLVGIISHVAELRERIETRLEVVKGENGSRAFFVVE